MQPQLGWRRGRYDLERVHPGLNSTWLGMRKQKQIMQHGLFRHGRKFQRNKVKVECMFYTDERLEDECFMKPGS